MLWGEKQAIMSKLRVVYNTEGLFLISTAYTANINYGFSCFLALWGFVMKYHLSSLSSRNTMFQQTAWLGLKKKKEGGEKTTTGEKSDDPL